MFQSMEVSVSDLLKNFLKHSIVYPIPWLKLLSILNNLNDLPSEGSIEY